MTDAMEMHAISKIIKMKNRLSCNTIAGGCNFTYELGNTTTHYYNMILESIKIKSLMLMVRMCSMKQSKDKLH